MARSASYLWKNKNGVWYYLRKIPRRVQKVCVSKQIMKSLKTNDKAIAFEKVILLNKAYEHEWVNVIRQGGVSDSRSFYVTVRKIQNLKFGYPSSKQLLFESRFEILIKRIEALEQSKE